jgi:hypothetical protein
LKKILAFILLVAISVIAHADWVKINSPDTSVNLYLDKSVSEKSGPNMIKLWHIVDFATTQDYEGKAYRSIKANYEYDCAHLRYRGLILLLHAEPMGNGKTVYWTHGLWSLTHDPSTWMQPAENSHDAALVTGACNQ